MNALQHAEEDVKKYGGTVSMFLPIHQWLDISDTAIGDARHMALRHHTLGVSECEQFFGMTITFSDGGLVYVADIATEHIKRDLGFLPTPYQWLSQLPISGWMLGWIDAKRPVIDVDFASYNALSEVVTTCINSEVTSDGFASRIAAVLRITKPPTVPDAQDTNENNPVTQEVKETQEAKETQEVKECSVYETIGVNKCLRETFKKVIIEALAAWRNNLVGRGGVNTWKIAFNLLETSEISALRTPKLVALFPDMPTIVLDQILTNGIILLQTNCNRDMSWPVVEEFLKYAKEMVEVFELWLCDTVEEMTAEPVVPDNTQPIAEETPIADNRPTKAALAACISTAVDKYIHVNSDTNKYYRDLVNNLITDPSEVVNEIAKLYPHDNKVELITTCVRNGLTKFQQCQASENGHFTAGTIRSYLIEGTYILDAMLAGYHTSIEEQDERGEEIGAVIPAAPESTSVEDAALTARITTVITDGLRRFKEYGKISPLPWQSDLDKLYTMPEQFILFPPEYKSDAVTTATVKAIKDIFDTKSISDPYRPIIINLINDPSAIVKAVVEEIKRTKLQPDSVPTSDVVDTTITSNGTEDLTVEKFKQILIDWKTDCRDSRQPWSRDIAVLVEDPGKYLKLPEKYKTKEILDCISKEICQLKGEKLDASAFEAVIHIVKHAEKIFDKIKSVNSIKETPQLVKYDCIAQYGHMKHCIIEWIKDVKPLNTDALTQLYTLAVNAPVLIKALSETLNSSFTEDQNNKLIQCVHNWSSGLTRLRPAEVTHHTGDDPYKLTVMVNARLRVMTGNPNAIEYSSPPAVDYTKEMIQTVEKAAKAIIKKLVEPEILLNNQTDFSMFNALYLKLYSISGVFITQLTSITGIVFTADQNDKLLGGYSRWRLYGLEANLLRSIEKIGDYLVTQLNV